MSGGHVRGALRNSRTFQGRHPERALIDLDERLRRWRPPIAIADDGSWAAGTDPAFLADLVDYWRHGYDWQRCRKRSTAGPTTWSISAPSACISSASPAPGRWRAAPMPWSSPMAGRARSSSSSTSSTGWLAPRPPRRRCPRCLLTSSCRRCRAMASPARRPARDGSTGPIGPRAIAGLWHRLVHERLNYRRPTAYRGGDWGAVVSLVGRLRPSGDGGEGRMEVGRPRPASHLQHDGPAAGIDLRKTKVSPAERRGSTPCEPNDDDKVSYQRIQATRPQTLGSPSPIAGRAGGLDRGKFQAWSDCAGNPLARFSMDLLLDNVMVYWLTGTAGTSTLALSRLCSTIAARPSRGQRVETPTGFAAFPCRSRHRPRGVGRARLQSAAVHGDAQGWPLRCARGAGTAGRRHPRLLPSLRFGAAND